MEIESGLERLMKWTYKHKSHAFELFHDNGYGAGEGFAITLFFGPSTYNQYIKLCQYNPDTKEYENLTFDQLLHTALDKIEKLEKIYYESKTNKT